MAGDQRSTIDRRRFLKAGAAALASSVGTLRSVLANDSALRTPRYPPELVVRIAVVGIGKIGARSIEQMIAESLDGVDYMVAETDVRLGRSDELAQMLAGYHIVFIVAGLGDDIGTAPVIAGIARQLGIPLTIGIIPHPFHFEGEHRGRLAQAVVDELSSNVASLFLIPNHDPPRLTDQARPAINAHTPSRVAQHSVVRCVSNLVNKRGLIGMDFADVQFGFDRRGLAVIGVGEASGESKCHKAVQAAATSEPLRSRLADATAVLINITSGPDTTLWELDDAISIIRDQLSFDANVIFGDTQDETMLGRARVSVIATGLLMGRRRQLMAKSEFCHESRRWG